MEIKLSTSAAGGIHPPLVIFDRKTLNPLMTIGEVPNTFYGLSSNGWITQDLFKEWFSRCFLAFVPSVRPLLLLLDGHSSHYCPNMIKMAAESQVILFILPPHTTHLTQPLDKSAFAALKVRWKEVCHNFMAKNPGRVVTRYNFCALLSEAWSSSMSIKNVMAGFSVTGIYPFDRTAIRLPESDYKSFKPEVLPKSNGLAYLPLYSPAQLVKQHRGTNPSTPVIDHSDLHLGDRLVDSQELFVDLDQCAPLKLVKGRTLSRFLKTPLPPSKIPTKREKSCGKVLTSVENIRVIEAKERSKQEMLRLKEERKQLWEEKKKSKEVQVLKKRNTKTSENCVLV